MKKLFDIIWPSKDDGRRLLGPLSPEQAERIVRAAEQMNVDTVTLNDTLVKEYLSRTGDAVQR